MCESRKLNKVMGLTPTPPGNNLLKKEELDNPEKVYPLDLYLCNNCGHLQLGHVVDPQILYQCDYSYVSATSQKFVSHLSNFADEMVERFQITPDSLIADIGSNDGTCLSFFQKNGMRVLGIDPATKIAEKANNSGIETIADFFSFKLAKLLRAKFGPATFITSHNACAHIDNLDDVIKGVNHWLDKNGIFVLEVGYLYDIYSNIWFDTIYHEHLDFHTIGPMVNLFERFDMEVIDAQRVSPQGGSIRVITQKKGNKQINNKSVEELKKLEISTGLYEENTYLEFDRRISNVRRQLLSLLNKLKKTGKVIAGYGAPTKATTLMTHFQLGSNLIDFIVEDNPLKQGLYTPISHIPIFNADTLYERKPDYVLILAWNFSDSIMKIHQKYRNEIGKFILPMPIPKIAK